ncbi:MAG: sensor histidine kinase [Candidatus Fimimorpha sp.]
MNQNMCIRNGALVIISRIKSWKEYFKSFRVHIFFLIIFCGMIPVLLMKEVILYSYQGRLINQRVAELRYACTVLANQLDSSNVLETSLTDQIIKEVTWISENYGGRILFINDSYRIILDTYVWDEGKTCISQEIFQAFDGESYYNTDNKNWFVEFTVPITQKLDRNTKIVGIIAVSTSTASVRDIMKDVRDKATILDILITVSIVALAVIMSGKFTRPWKQVVSIIDQVKEGNLNVKFPENSKYRETEQVIDTFRHVLERLNAIDRSRQEFVSNVSHELKTPITSIRVLADSLMCEDNVPVELYREFMGDISEEIDRETKIINDLLSMVKMERENAVMNISKVNINELIEMILKRLRPIAKKREIDVVFESFRPIMAEVDETKLSLALNNLVENAIKYNNDGGWVKVSLNADHKFFFVKVMDGGVGIPEDALPHVFERFYRVDRARSRETGGTGLGLAITMQVVQLHSGWIKVDSKKGEGTAFLMRIPLNYIA